MSSQSQKPRMSLVKRNKEFIHEHVTGVCCFSCLSMAIEKRDIVGYFINGQQKSHPVLIMISTQS